jgi:hypothetical protein
LVINAALHPGHQNEELLASAGNSNRSCEQTNHSSSWTKMQPLCNSEGCMAFLGNDRRESLITADTVHLTPFASVWLARQQLAPLVMMHMGD